MKVFFIIDEINFPKLSFIVKALLSKYAIVTYVSRI